MADEEIVQKVISLNDKRIQNIVYGLVLGDGFLSPETKREKFSSLRLKYDDKYFSYVEWLHKELAPLGVSPIKIHTGYHQHRFDTQSSTWLGKVRRLFYPNGKKLIPKTIKKLIVDPISVAVWYMDDGNFDFRSKYHCNASFATYCFSNDDCNVLKEVLLENFGIHTSIHKSTMRGKEYYRLYVLARSTTDFMTLVRPYVLNCFSHKVKL